jgi:RNA-binding protein YlmH
VTCVGQAERAGRTWVPLYTDFYTPPVVAAALRLLQPLAGVSGLAWGGYNGAERARIVIGQDELIDGLAANPAQARG